MKFLKITLFFLMVFNLSCQNKSEAEVEQLFDQLIKNHDEVMPKTMQITSVLQNLNKAAETASEEKKAEVTTVTNRLNEVEKQMNDWMTNLGEAMNSHEANKLEVGKKLSDEILKIKTETDASISDAKKLTSELSGQ